MILHLVSKADWDASAPDQPYLPKDFARDGFIHCTSGDEGLLKVANAFYAGASGDFLVLSIDETRLKAPVRWEAPVHPPAAITPAAALAPAADGVQAAEPLPPDLGDAHIAAHVALPAKTTAPAAAVQAADEPRFPHIYGPLNRDAIVGVRRMLRDDTGGFNGFEAVPGPEAEDDPLNPLHLKKPSQLANELLDATDQFSDSLKRYKDRIESRMADIDKRMKDL